MRKVALVATAFLPVFQAVSLVAEESNVNSKPRTIRSMKPSVQVDAQGGVSDVSLAEGSKAGTVRSEKSSALEVSAQGGVSRATEPDDADYPCPTFFRPEDAETVSTVGGAKDTFQEYCMESDHSEIECEKIASDVFKDKGEHDAPFEHDEKLCAVFDDLLHADTDLHEDEAGLIERAKRATDASKVRSLDKTNLKKGRIGDDLGEPVCSNTNGGKSDQYPCKCGSAATAKRCHNTEVCKNVDSTTGKGKCKRRDCHEWDTEADCPGGFSGCAWSDGKCVMNCMGYTRNGCKTPGWHPKNRAIVELDPTEEKCCMEGCERPFGWCKEVRHGARGIVGHYDKVDCDGDGVADHHCVNSGGTNEGFISSKDSCKSSWPHGKCMKSTKEPEEPEEPTAPEAPKSTETTPGHPDVWDPGALKVDEVDDPDADEEDDEDEDDKVDDPACSSLKLISDQPAATGKKRWCGHLKNTDQKTCEESSTYMKCGKTAGKDTVYYKCKWSDAGQPGKPGKKCYAQGQFTCPSHGLGPCA